MERSLFRIRSSVCQRISYRVLVLFPSGDFEEFAGEKTASSWSKKAIGGSQCGGAKSYFLGLPLRISAVVRVLRMFR